MQHTLMRVLKMYSIDRKRHIGITAKNIFHYLIFALLVLYSSTAAQALNGPCNSFVNMGASFSNTNLNRLLSIKSSVPVNSQIGSEIIVTGGLVLLSRRHTRQ
jgi:hypothetical protein